MANSIPFKLITPTSVAFEGRAELVIAVTTEGEEGFLPQHAPFLAALKPGVLRANVTSGDEAASRLEIATGAGFVQALPDRIAVLVDEAVRFEDVDVARTREELAAALERQKQAGGDPPAFAREQATVDFANAKLRLAGQG
jgi:F-type H+-transporting ATPase subunit epsilon